MQNTRSAKQKIEVPTMNKCNLLKVLFLTFCLFATKVQSTNYFFSDSRPDYQLIREASAPSISVVDIKTVRNGAEKDKTNQPGAMFYYPQSRGGKILNLTLVTESTHEDKSQSRIVNQPGQYPNFSRLLKLKAVSFLSPPAYLQELQGGKRVPPISQNTPKHSRTINMDHPPDNLSAVETDSAYPPEQSEMLLNQNIRQAKVSSYAGSQQVNKSVYAFPAQKTDKIISTKYKPPVLYQKITAESLSSPPLTKDTIQTWPCFCVPHYLCKNGFIQSGGRSVAVIRRTSRSTTYPLRNHTYTSPLVQGKVMNAYVVEQVTSPEQCEENKICCRLSFEDHTTEDADDDYYPVATPLPDPYYPEPPRNQDKESQVCGIRRAYGIQGRLKQLQYSADVSEFGEYPWQAAILRKVVGQKNLYLCGGVLVSSQWVATAAHCIKKEKFSPLIIRLGEWDVNRKDEVYPYVEKEVDLVIVHPDFNPDTLYNDLALIHMESGVDIRLPHVTPACLPRRGTLFEDQKCWVSGWGKDFFGPQGEYQNVLKEVDVPVVDRADCIAKLQNTNLGPDFTLHPGFLCAGGEAGKDACTGDGGSPLVCKSGNSWYVVGLVSWGIGCGQPGVPGVYMNMLYYLDWIYSFIWS